MHTLERQSTHERSGLFSAPRQCGAIVALTVLIAVAIVAPASADQLQCAPRPTTYTFGFEDRRADVRVTVQNCVVSWGTKAKAYTNVSWAPAPGIALARALPRKRRMTLGVTSVLERGAGVPIVDFGAPLRQVADYSRLRYPGCLVYSVAVRASGSSVCQTSAPERSDTYDPLAEFARGTRISGDSFLLHFGSAATTVNGSRPPTPVVKPVYVGGVPEIRGTSLQTAGSPVIMID